MFSTLGHKHFQSPSHHSSICADPKVGKYLTIQSSPMQVMTHWGMRQWNKLIGLTKQKSVFEPQLPLLWGELVYSDRNSRKSLLPEDWLQGAGSLCGCGEPRQNWVAISIACIHFWKLHSITIFYLYQRWVFSLFSVELDFPLSFISRDWSQISSTNLWYAVLLIKNSSVWYSAIYTWEWKEAYVNRPVSLCQNSFHGKSTNTLKWMKIFNVKQHILSLF